PAEEGLDLYERAQRILAEVDQAEAALTSGQAEPQGLLRVSAPVAFGRLHVGPVCGALVREYRMLSIDLVLTDRLVDLIEEGVDVVVRIGPPQDSQLVMRKLIDDYRIVVGAPGYLQERGTPATPAELEAHDCVHYRGVGARWRLVSLTGEAVEVQADSRLRSNSGEAALDWALAGYGLVMNSWVDVKDYLRSGCSPMSRHSRRCPSGPNPTRYELCKRLISMARVTSRASSGHCTKIPSSVLVLSDRGSRFIEPI